jgi:hypothetical protein
MRSRDLGIDLSSNMRFETEYGRRMCRFRGFVKGDLILEAVSYLYGIYEAGIVA